MKNKITLMITLLLSISVSAQNQEEDRAAIDKVVAKLYESISFTNSEGANGQILDAIHYPDAKIGVVDTFKIQMFGEKEFRKKNSEIFEKNKVVSFVEKEIGSVTQVYGGVANRFSTYEFIVKTIDRELKVRGVNSIQLIKDPKKGWLIYSTVFSDTMSYPEIPDIYLER